jgi:hypothetical protein
MTRFVRTLENELVNLANVRKISVWKRSDGFTYLKAMLDGEEQESVELYGEDLGEFEYESGPVIPASPGFTFLVALDNDGDDEKPIYYQEYVIIGWQLRAGCYPNPIAYGYRRCEEEVSGLVRTPDGRLLRWNGGFYMDEEEWRTEAKEIFAMRIEWRRRQAEREKRAGA